MATGDSYYEIRENGTVGYAIIVANEFERGDDMHRDGTKAEIKILTEIFSKLRFETKIFGEVTSREFIDKMNDIRDDPILKNHDMIALAICSHGLLNEILFPVQETVDKNKVKPEASAVSSAHSIFDISPKKVIGIERLTVKEIQKSVMSEYLDEKPKLIVLNACRSKEDANEVRSVGDRFTLFSTKTGQKSSKSEFKDQGYVPMFLRKLYEVINNQNPNDIFDSIHDKINDTYAIDSLMKTKYEERSDMEKDGVNKQLRLKLQSRLKDFDVLFREKEETDSVISVPGPNKKLIINGTSSATSIAYNYNPKQPCYYICDPQSSKIIVFLADFNRIGELTINCPLESPRYIRCISHEKSLFISHELGVIKVDISKGNLESEHKGESLVEVEEYISPCLAANETDSLLFILDRFSHSENNKMRKISVYNITQKTFMESYPKTIELSRELLLEKYSPIITDMNFRQYNPEQQQLLILAYLPSPCLMIYTIGKKDPIEFTYHSEFEMKQCEPCFIASYLNYTLISSPNTEKSLIKLNDEEANENERYTQLNIENTQAALIHSNGNAVITVIEENNCLIYCWDGITN